MKKFFNAVMFIMLLVGFSTTAKANVNQPITWAAGAEGDYVQMDNSSFVDVHTGGNDQGNMYPNFAFVKATDAGNVTAISMQNSIENTNEATIKTENKSMEAVTFHDVKVTNTKLSQDMQSMIFSFRFTVNGDQADVKNYEVFVSRAGNEYMGPMTIVKKANGDGNITTYIGTVAVPINDVALPVNTANIDCYFKVRANYTNGTTGAPTQAPVVTVSTKADETGDPKFYITLTNYDSDTRILSYSIRATGDLSTIDNVVPGWAVSNDPNTTPTETNGEFDADADSDKVRILKPADFANSKVITGRLKCDVDPSKSNKMWASLAIIYNNNAPDELKNKKVFIFDGPYDVRPNSERPGFVTVTNWERIDYKSGHITVEFALNTPQTASSEGEKTLDDIQSVSIAFGHSCADHPAATERPLNRIDIPVSVLDVVDGKFTYTFEFKPRQELYPDGMHTGSQIQLWPKGRVNYKDGSNSPTNTNQKAVWVNFNPSVNMTLDASVINKDQMQDNTTLNVSYDSTVDQTPDNFNASEKQFYNYKNSIPDVDHYLVWMSTADDQYLGTTSVAKNQFVDGKLADGAFIYTLTENFNNEAWLKIMPVYSDNTEAAADNTKATQTYLGWIDNRVPANPGTLTMTVNPVYVTVNAADKTTGTLLCNYNIQMDATAVANVTGFELYFSRQKQNGETVADDIDLEYLSAVKPDKNVFWPDADGNVSYTMNLANLPANVKSFPIWAKVRPVYAEGFGAPAQGLIQVNTLDDTPMLVFACNSTTATSDEGGKTEFTLHCTQNQDNLKNFDINWTYQVKENGADTDTWTECADVKGLNFSMTEAANKDGFNIADHVFTGTVFLGPVNKAAVSNLHADLLARPVDGDNINLNYGYNQAYTIDTSAPGLPTGIEGLDADSNEALWFNLQGVRVVNPEAGQIYIVVKNGKASRVMK